MTPTDFIARWQKATGSELANAQLFVTELCELLGLPRPNPATGTAEDDAYVFERRTQHIDGNGSENERRIDCYKRGCFVLEAKKIKAGTHTKGFDDARLRAHSQAQAYARDIPASEGRVPFIMVVDVGHFIELYSEFTQSGATYTPFPDPRSHRIALADLAKPEIQARLKTLWLDPTSLNPARQSAKVTREVAAALADIAKSLEAAGHAPQPVAEFLTRCLFTFFAEDVNLLPKRSFTELLETLVQSPQQFMPLVSDLWTSMDKGAFSLAIRADVIRFNGKLFKNPTVLPLTSEQIALLLNAAKKDWSHVEPAIIGTLLERALSPTERHSLGAHYTPRAYVERLVLPTVIEPLRADWALAQATALTLAREGKTREAAAELHHFHHQLCTVRVLDPACGSGNFLYVTLEHLKRLEGEVLNALDELGAGQTGFALDTERATATETVDPHQFLGIEINPRAAALAELVLWIGYLQWHFRTRGDATPPLPVLKDFRTIENRDAVLAYDSVHYIVDANGKPVTRWDGITFKKHPVTGEDVPDESAQAPQEQYKNPRQAIWPEADFVVGNPPFIGNKRMRLALGDGYVQALRTTWPQVEESADFVMYWWQRAAELTSKTALRRFGLITTNSIRQSFNRRALSSAMASKPPLHLVFAIPDHPWTDAGDGADVRIAMTVGAASPRSRDGLLLTVIAEHEKEESEGIAVTFSTKIGLIHADLTVGANVGAAIRLRANSDISNRGVIPHGEGFLLTNEQAVSVGFGRDTALFKHVRPYRNGKDLADVPRGYFVIDLIGLSQEQVRDKFPALYQWLIEHVKPHRDQQTDRDLREKWWLHRRNNQDLRNSIFGLRRYIATGQTAKHRLFQFLDVEILPDDKLIAIALEDGASLAILSSYCHVAWALTSGSRLGVGNDPVYNKSSCFDAFPFPVPNPEQRATLAELGERLDAHRKRQQAAHPGLTLTGMYNVLEKLRNGEELNAKEKNINEQGLCSLLKEIHDDIDRTVLQSYGWSDLVIKRGDDLTATLLERLTALNAERAVEEARGEIRWLRPEYQNPKGESTKTSRQIEVDLGDDAAIVVNEKIKRQPWPAEAPAQAKALFELLSGSRMAMNIETITANFTGKGPWKKRVPDMLEMLEAVGRIRETRSGFIAS